jgi:hypothetical protein
MQIVSTFGCRTPTFQPIKNRPTRREFIPRRCTIRVAVSSPTLCPVRFATMRATRRQCAGVRPAWVVPLGKNHVALKLARLPIGLAAVVADEGIGVGLRQSN